jgi:hypothetical protein
MATHMLRNSGEMGAMPTASGLSVYSGDQHVNIVGAQQWRAVFFR